MIQSGGRLAGSLVGIRYIFSKEGTNQLIKIEPEITRGLRRYFVNKKINEFNDYFHDISYFIICYS